MEDFVSEDLARKLKEKGYPMEIVPIDNRSDKPNPIPFALPYDHPEWQYCDAWYIPTISQVLKWLRDEKKIHIGVLYHNYYAVWIQPMKRNESEHVIHDCKTHEAAAIAGIEYCLENLI